MVEHRTAEWRRAAAGLTANGAVEIPRGVAWYSVSGVCITVLLHVDFTCAMGFRYI